MSRILFSVKYSVIPEERERYLDVVRELKNLMKYDGLSLYSVFEHKNKKNNFEELYIFKSEEAFENFEEAENERIDILMSKLSELIEDHSTQFSTMYEVECIEEQ